MSIRTEAEDNLRIIRSLMEKATVYRAISAPGALFGGLVGTAASVRALAGTGPRDCAGFLQEWMAVAVLTGVVNLWLLRRDSIRRDEPFVSPGMRLALRAMLPAIIGGGLCAVVLAQGGCALLASLWVLFYGISLLAASHFAPKSICWLGRAFFVAGALLLLAGTLIFEGWRGFHETAIAHAIMGVTFGLFHLIYAALTWPRRAAARGES
jgi:hypothetical protein